jgi:hypothetical protein
VLALARRAPQAAPFASFCCPCGRPAHRSDGGPRHPGSVNRASPSAALHHPYDAEPLRGREAIVADWRGERDELGSWDANYELQLIEGDTAVATGETLCANGNTFSNLFVMRFDDDRQCASFVESYMQHPV